MHAAPSYHGDGHIGPEDKKDPQEIAGIPRRGREQDMNIFATGIVAPRRGEVASIVNV